MLIGILIGVLIGMLIEMLIVKYVNCEGGVYGHDMAGLSRSRV